MSTDTIFPQINPAQYLKSYYYIKGKKISEVKFFSKNTFCDTYEKLKKMPYIKIAFFFEKMKSSQNGGKTCLSLSIFWLKSFMLLIRFLIFLGKRYVVPIWIFMEEKIATSQKTCYYTYVIFSYSQTCTFQKKFCYLLHWKPFKNDEKCFLFHLKSSFHSQDI